MKKVLAILALLLLLSVVGVWFFVFRGKKKNHSGPKEKPVAVSKHSDAFNQNMDSSLTAYYSMIEGFVNWDTTAVVQHATALKTALGNFRGEELNKDTAKDAQIIYLLSMDYLGYSKGDVDNIISQPGLEKKRLALNALTANFRDLLAAVRYDKDKVYYQECPMAFNDSEPAYWLGKSEEIRNPYLGTQHPKYKAGMLNCGSSKGVVVKDTAQ